MILLTIFNVIAVTFLLSAFFFILSLAINKHDRRRTARRIRFVALIGSVPFRILTWNWRV